MKFPYSKTFSFVGGILFYDKHFKYADEYIHRGIEFRYKLRPPQQNQRRSLGLPRTETRGTAQEPARLVQQNRNNIQRVSTPKQLSF